MEMFVIDLKDRTHKILDASVGDTSKCLIICLDLWSVVIKMLNVTSYTCLGIRWKNLFN